MLRNSTDLELPRGNRAAYVLGLWMLTTMGGTTSAFAQAKSHAPEPNVTKPATGDLPAGPLLDWVDPNTSAALPGVLAPRMRDSSGGTVIPWANGASVAALPYSPVEARERLGNEGSISRPKLHLENRLSPTALLPLPTAAWPPIPRQNVRHASESHRFGATLLLPATEPSGRQRAVAGDPPVAAADAWLAAEVTPESWWRQAMRTPQLAAAQGVPFSTEMLVVQTLQHSFQLRVDGARPRIEQTRIVEAAAEFDWNTLVGLTWDDVSEPVGSLLETNAARFKRDKLTSEVGFQKRNAWGGDFSATQQLAIENSNSQFFVPPNQGQTQLLLRYNQPLLRGAGKTVNRSAIVRSNLAASQATHDFVFQVQQRLRDVVAVYWDLYAARGDFVIRRRLTKQAAQLVSSLERRQNVDGSVEQLLRANGVLESRKSDALAAQRVVQDLQAQLRNLVNSTELMRDDAIELLVTDEPARDLVPADQPGAFATAMQHRPDFAAAMREVRQTAIRNQVAANDVLPDLRVVLESYVQGLRGNADVGAALESQFNEGEPAYSVAVLWQTAIGRRAARAAKQRADLEVAQAKDRLRVRTEQIWLEVGNAVRQLRTTHQQVQRQRNAMLQFSKELHLVTKRRELLPPTGQNGQLLLTDLLNAQARLGDAERSYLRRRADYAMAVIELRRSMGTLTEH